MSADANPDNKNGKYRYRAESVGLDFYEEALDQEMSKPEWSGENFKKARHFRVIREER